MKMVSSSILSRSATVHYPSTEQLKYSNCAVSQSNLQEICIHCHSTAHLIHHFDQGHMYSTVVIQHRIWVRPDIFIKWVRPA